VENVPENPDSEETAPPVVEQISLPPIAEEKKRDLLEQLDRLLAFALREEGLHLWDMRYLDGNALRPVRSLLAHEIDETLREKMTALEVVFSGLMALPWSERIVPLTAAHVVVLEALAIVPEAAFEFSPVSEILLPEQTAGPNKKTEKDKDEKESGSRRRRRRGGRSREDKESSVQKAPAAPQEKRARPHDLGDDRFTGRALSEVARANEELVAALSGAGVKTVAQLILLPPKEHSDLKCLESLEGLSDDQEVGVAGVVRACWTRIKAGKYIRELDVAWNETSVRFSWDEEQRIERPLVGKILSAVGVLKQTDGLLLMENPKLWRADSRGTIRRPIYGIDAVDDSELNGFIRQQMDHYLPGLRDSLPENVIRLGGLMGLSDAIRELHSPTGGLRLGRRRFVFEELFRHQLEVAAQVRSHRKGIAHPIQHDLISQLAIQHDIELNDGQEKAFDEIRRDLAQPLAMNRLLQGDVSSGKAMVVLLSGVMVAASRSQVLFIAPDALAAEHRYLFAEPLFRSIGLVPQLVVGRPTAGQLDAIKRGQANMIFATPEFIDPVVPEFKRLGLVVTEERSSFGKLTPDSFSQGKVFPDFLVVTSVPVPPSLAFTIFSDVDISVIDSQNAHVECIVAQPNERNEVYSALREILDAGKQAYVVFPMRDGHDVIDRQRGEILASAMAQEAFPGHKVALFHGQMNREERFQVFHDFLHRKVDVLIATTAIEDAPEVDNAAGVMVENADHFDLVRLYRLKGQVGTEYEDGKCFFVLSKDPSESGAKLVNFVAKETDAFQLAEKDREQRGDEALIGQKIEQMPDFEWADLSVDRDLLLKARRTVFAVLSADPNLERRIYRGLVGQPTKAAQENSSETDKGGAGRKRRPRRRKRPGSGGESNKSSA
jgi:ATP-dependent DNA helicase RecG